MNKHKIFHRVGFGLIFGLSLGITTYLASLGVLIPFLGATSYGEAIEAALGVGGFFWFASFVFSLIGGTPWDDKLIFHVEEV